MKNKVLIILAALILSSFVACAKSEDDIEFESLGGQLIYSSSADTETGTAALTEPYDYMSNDLTQFIKIGKYKGLTVTKKSSNVTDEEFEDKIDKLLESYSYYTEYTDRAVEEGETILADYTGYIDGVAFEGGTATNQEITVSSDSGYIPGFAEAFVGEMPGVEFDFNVTFPENYYNSELAGVEATFVCTIHCIYGDELIIPELTDEFVNEKFGYNNTEEFRIIYRSNVEEQNEFYVESLMYSDLWTQIVDDAELISYPEEEVLRVYSDQKAVYEQYASYYGTDYDTFLSSYMGLTDDNLLEESRKYVKEDLVMYQLVKDLGITLTDEEYNEGLNLYADYYGNTVDEILSYYGEDTIKTTLLWQELMDTVILETNVVEE